MAKQNELSAAFLECNFLFNEIMQMEMRGNALRGKVKNNLGTGMYAEIQKIDHDKKIFQRIYNENKLFILLAYQEKLDIEFELIKK